MNYFHRLTQRFAGAVIFAVLAILLALLSMALGCGEPGLEPILQQLTDDGSDTSTVVQGVAQCYKGLRVENTEYNAIFDKECVDKVITGKQDTQPSNDAKYVEATVLDINNNPAIFDGKYVSVQAYVNLKIGTEPDTSSVMIKNDLLLPKRQEKLLIVFGSKLGSIFTKDYTNFGVAEHTEPFFLDLQVDAKYEFKIFVIDREGTAMAFLVEKPIQIQE